MYAKVADTLVVSENGSTCLFHDTNMIPRTKAEYDWALENDYVIPAFRNGEYNVEKFLDYVDVKLDWYIPSEEAFNVINFIRMSMGKEPENLNSKAHYFFIDAMLGSDEIEPYYRVRNIPYYTMNDSALILSSREFSKALHWETKIATPTGPVEIQDIEDGDMVISRTGKPTRVIKKSEMIFDNTFKMELEDGRSFKSSNDHKHILWKRTKKYVGYFKDGERCSKSDGGKAWSISGMEEVEMTSQELDIVGATRPREVTNSHRRGYENIYYIPRMDSGIQYEPVHSPIDPYTVGVILGDGSVGLGKRLSTNERQIKVRKSMSENSSLSNKKYEENQIWSNNRGSTRITVHKDDISSLLKNIPYECKVLDHTNPSGTTNTVVLPSELNKTIVDFIGVERSYTKRVPSVLLTGSVSQRLAVLQGLMDTDGTINKKGSPSYTTVSKGLAEDVVDLVQTLGGSARISERKTDSKFGIAYQVMISINTYSIFRLQRKKDRETYVPARDCFPIKSFEMVHSELAYCLTVECPTQSFVMADGLLTHNSVLATFFILYMAYTGKKPGFGKVNLLLYVSDRMEGNVKMTMRTIKGLVKKSEFLSSSFEDAIYTDSMVRLIRHPSTQKEIRAYNKAMKAGKKLDEVPYRGQRTFTLQGIGSSGGRGSRDEDLARPDGAIFDDLIANEKDAFSTATLAAIESTIEADVGKSLSGNKHFKIFIGTAYHENDPIYRRAGNGAAIPVVFPRAEKAPHGDIYDSDGKWVRGPMTKEEFISVWDDRHSFENQRREYAKAELALKNGDPMTIRKTDQEYYVRVVSATDQLIPEQYIQFGNVNHVWKNAADYLWRVTTDYTTTNALSSDDSGAMLWAISWDRVYHLMEISVHKKSIEEQYDDTIAMNRRARKAGATFVETAVEIDGQQAAHLYGLRKRAEEVGYLDMYFARQFDPQTGQDASWEGIKSRGSGDKLWRLKMFSPNFYRKAVIFNKILEHDPDMSTLLTQIKMTTHSEIKAKDDAIDTVSQNYLCSDSNIPMKPREQASESGYNKQLSLHDYLLSSGSSQSEDLGDYGVTY